MKNNSLTPDISQNNHQLIIMPKKRFDIFTYESISHMIAQHIDQTTQPDIVLDLSLVDFLDSPTIKMINKVAKQINEAGGVLKTLNASTSVKIILDLGSMTLPNIEFAEVI